MCLGSAGRSPSENRTRTSARGRGLPAENKCRRCPFISHWFQTSHPTQAPFWYFQTMSQAVPIFVEPDHITVSTFDCASQQGRKTPLSLFSGEEGMLRDSSEVVQETCATMRSRIRSLMSLDMSPSHDHSSHLGSYIT